MASLAVGLEPPNREWKAIGNDGDPAKWSRLWIGAWRMKHSREQIAGDYSYYTTPTALPRKNAANGINY